MMGISPAAAEANGSNEAASLHHPLVLSKGRLCHMHGASLPRLCRKAAAIVLAWSLITPGTCADFYQGKTLKLLIGYSAGGGHDLYARVLAKYLGRHIPGDPTVVPSNMEGAGSLRAANYLYSAAPRDGTVIGTFSRSFAIAPLISTAPFDARKFTWLGSVTKDVSVCTTWNSSAIKSWDDMMSRQFVAGGEAAGSDPNIFALMYKNVFGANVKLVSGYPGTNDIMLAMERGEVDGLCGISWSTIKGRHADWISQNKINVPVQAAMQKDPQLPNVPLVFDFVKSKEQTQILKLLVATQVLARPFAAPPEVPIDQTRILRKAFGDTMSDPDFRAETERLSIDVNPISGASIQALVEEIYMTPQDVLTKAAAAIAE
jgi:tripartite-type tricarboxylate transporter receptor subunit TctC